MVKTGPNTGRMSELRGGDMTNQRNINEEQGLMGRSRMARAWRFVAASALTLPLVVAATSGVAFWLL